jgi:hypothetical protein
MNAMQTHEDDHEISRFSSLSLGERLVLAARIAVQTHLEQDAQQRNRQQAKRVAETLGIGGAGPIGLRVMDDPALAPLTLARSAGGLQSACHPRAVDQAEPLRRLIARRARDEREAA